MKRPTSERLADIRIRTLAATPPPWRCEEDDVSWRLYGTAGYVSGDTCLGRWHKSIRLQVLTAPKHGTPYAEYWPCAADGDFIVNARADMEVLLCEIDYLTKELDKYRLFRKIRRALYRKPP